MHLSMVQVKESWNTRLWNLWGHYLFEWNNLVNTNAGILVLVSSSRIFSRKILGKNIDEDTL